MPFEAGFEVLSWLDPISLGPFQRRGEGGGDRHLENFEETSFLAFRLGTIATTGGEFSPFLNRRFFCSGIGRWSRAAARILFVCLGRSLFRQFLTSPPERRRSGVVGACCWIFQLRIDSLRADI